jgi:hypothetical protein
VNLTDPLHYRGAAACLCIPVMGEGLDGHRRAVTGSAQDFVGEQVIIEPIPHICRRSIPIALRHRQKRLRCGCGGILHLISLLQTRTIAPSDGGVKRLPAG